jgi:hypothetical protein
VSLTVSWGTEIHYMEGHSAYGNVITLMIKNTVHLLMPTKGALVNIYNNVTHIYQTELSCKTYWAELHLTLVNNHGIKF